MHEEDVFKIYRGNSNEIWETSFLISCTPLLKSYIHFLHDEKRIGKALDDPILYKLVDRKLKNVQNCLKNLDNFCNNRLLNTSPNQKYGEVNPFRQKVLREQYFLETVVQILHRSLTEEEILKHREFTSSEGSPQKTTLKSLKSMVHKMKFSTKPLRNTEKAMIEDKIQICKIIYQLLVSICKNNPLNEIYTYRLIGNFRLHIKYYEEAVACISQIIGQNEEILSKLNEGLETNSLLEGIKGGKKKSNQRPIKDLRILGLNIEFQASVEKPIEQEKNLIYFFLQLAAQNNLMKRDVNYLHFLSSICSIGPNGISVNQELLFKLFNSSPELKTAVFYDLNIKGNELMISITDSIQTKIDDFFGNQEQQNKWKDELIYFNQQIAFYSSLLTGRNYLWKKVLEKTFPIQFLFDQISNDKLSLEVRSKFCDLALTLYVDHDPLNPVIVPSLCRIFESKKTIMTNFKKHSTVIADKTVILDKENFTLLVVNTLDIIKKSKEEIVQKLTQLFDKPDEKKSENDNESQKKRQKEIQTAENRINFLDNVLLVNILKLLNKILRFDLLNILEKKESYYQIVHDCAYLLEYEKSNPGMSYILAKIREDNLKETLTDKNKIKVFGFFGNIVTGFTDMAKGVVSQVGGAFFGAAKKSGTKGGGLNNDDSEEALFANNPVMKGMLFLKNQLEQSKTKEDLIRVQELNEILVKEEICDIFNFIIEMRQDYLLSNILGWFDALIDKIPADKTDTEKIQLLEKAIGENIYSVIPQIQKTGIKEIDEKFKIANESGLFNALGSLAAFGGSVVGMSKKKKKGHHDIKNYDFQNFTVGFEMPDLDFLFKKPEEAKASKTYSKELLPSLLTTFLMTSNRRLENKLLNIIMKCFD